MLYNEYTPKKLEDVIGQEHAIKMLKTIIQRDLKVHAILFSGIHGVGKTAIARIFARQLNCESLCENCEMCFESNKFNPNDPQNCDDILLVDGATHTGVDNIRSILKSIEYAPIILKHRVVIIDESHMLSKSAMDSLLISLQDPPMNTTFILTTTEVHKITDTLYSRCLHITLNRVAPAILIDSLSKINGDKLFKIPNNIISQIAHNSHGSVREAISNLEKITLLDSYDNIDHLLLYFDINKSLELFLLIMEGKHYDAYLQWKVFYDYGYTNKMLFESWITMMCEIAGWSSNQPNNLSLDFINEHMDLKESITLSLVMKFYDIILQYMQVDLQSADLSHARLFFISLTLIDDSDYINYNLQKLIRLKDITKS